MSESRSGLPRVIILHDQNDLDIAKALETNLNRSFIVDVARSNQPLERLKQLAGAAKDDSTSAADGASRSKETTNAPASSSIDNDIPNDELFIVIASANLDNADSNWSTLIDKITAKVVIATFYNESKHEKRSSRRSEDTVSLRNWYENHYWQESDQIKSFNKIVKQSLNLLDQTDVVILFDENDREHAECLQKSVNENGFSVVMEDPNVSIRNVDTFIHALLKGSRLEDGPGDKDGVIKQQYLTAKCILVINSPNFKRADKLNTLLRNEPLYLQRVLTICIHGEPDREPLDSCEIVTVISDWDDEKDNNKFRTVIDRVRCILNRDIDVFISYSRKDPDPVTVTQFVNSLSYVGFNVLWDPQIPPGKGLTNEIKGKILQCQAAVVFLSENSLESESSGASSWVKDELEFAQGLNKAVPVIIDRTPAKVFIKGWQFKKKDEDDLILPLSKERAQNLDSEFQRLVRGIKDKTQQQTYLSCFRNDESVKDKIKEIVTDSRTQRKIVNVNEFPDDYVPTKGWRQYFDRRIRYSRNVIIQWSEKYQEAAENINCDKLKSDDTLGAEICAIKADLERTVDREIRQRKYQLRCDRRQKKSLPEWMIGRIEDIRSTPLRAEDFPEYKKASESDTYPPEPVELADTDSPPVQVFKLESESEPIAVTVQPDRTPIKVQLAQGLGGLSLKDTLYLALGLGALLLLGQIAFTRPSATITVEGLRETLKAHQDASQAIVEMCNSVDHMKTQIAEKKVALNIHSQQLGALKSRVDAINCNLGEIKQRLAPISHLASIDKHLNSSNERLDRIRQAVNDQKIQIITCNNDQITEALRALKNSQAKNMVKLTNKVGTIAFRLKVLGSIHEELVKLGAECCGNKDPDDGTDETPLACLKLPSIDDSILTRHPYTRTVTSLYYYAMARGAFFDHQYAGAVTLLDRAIHYAPDDARYYYFRGLAKKCNGDLEDAVNDVVCGSILERKDSSRDSVSLALERIQGDDRLWLEKIRYDPAMQVTTTGDSNRK